MCLLLDCLLSRFLLNSCLNNSGHTGCQPLMRNGVFLCLGVVGSEQICSVSRGSGTLHLACVW